VVRIGVHADSAGVAMHLLHAVRSPLALEIVPLHHAGRAATLAGADDVDRFDPIEQLDGDLLAYLDALGRSAELANKPLRFAIGFGKRGDAGRGTAALPLAVEFGDVAALAAAGKSAFLVQESELHRFIAVAVLRLDLKDVTRTSLNDGHRDDLPRGIEYLRHPDLAAE